MKIRFNCEKCGRFFYRSRSRINQAKKEGYKARFCTNKCRRVWFSENKKTRKQIVHKHNNLKKTKLRKRIWHEDKFFGGVTHLYDYEKCEKCEKKSNNLVIHHIDGNTRNNDKDNHQVVCRSCHGYIHGLARGGMNWKGSGPYG